MLQNVFCVLFWGLGLVCIFRFVSVLQNGVTYVKKLHQIPCDRCVYFTGDYRLKCTVNPMAALTEEALHCRDFEAIAPFMPSNADQLACKGCMGCRQQQKMVKTDVIG